MATWTNIPNASLEPGAPARSADMIALRDNPIAIAEGASGAPKVRTAALQPPAAGLGYLIRRIQDSTTVASGHMSYPAKWDATAKSGVNQPDIVCLVPGVISAYLQHRVQAAYGDNASYARILKNGYLVAEWSNGSTTWVARAVDITVAAGDIITFQHRHTSDSYIGEWRALGIYSANPDFAVA